MAQTLQDSEVKLPCMIKVRTVVGVHKRQNSTRPPKFSSKRLKSVNMYYLLQPLRNRISRGKGCYLLSIGSAQQKVQILPDGKSHTATRIKSTLSDIYSIFFVPCSKIIMEKPLNIPLTKYKCHSFELYN